MTLLRITDDSTREEIAEAIGHLRDRQRAAVIPSTAAEIGAEIDALIEAWGKAR
jgi:hypothetical protein